jgi:prephenate dehydrogenase
VSRRFRRLAVLGLGLLGGSVAAAARERELADCVVGFGRRREPLDRALERGLVDEVAGDIAEAVQSADLVVLATPVHAMSAVLEKAAQVLTPPALVTDVGSVKAGLAESLPGLLPAGVDFVGSHPMVGSHETGVDFARADLFEGGCCVVSPHADADPAARDRLVEFWRALGARVCLRAPAEHDIEVAWVSHLPHVLAFAYAHALSGAPGSAFELAGSGFRDFVRIARSDSELWADILGRNRGALARPLEAVGGVLRELARAIETCDEAAQERILASASRQLAQLAPNGRDGQTLAPQEDLAARSGA